MKANFAYFLPELVLIGTIVVLLVTDFFVGAKRKSLYPLWAVLGLALSMAVNCRSAGLEPTSFFSGMVAFDPMARFFKYIFGLVGILGVLISKNSSDLDQADQPSYYTLLIALVLGMTLLSTSNHTLMLYLSLEMVSVLSNIMTASVRGVRRSSEAALKYVIYGGVASGVMAYGLSILYGLTGTMILPEMAAFIQTHAVSRPLLFTSVLFVMAGLGFKVASVPFHMWCPDVYEGAPTPFTAFLSVGPKAAGFAALIRFFVGGLSVSGLPANGAFVLAKQAGWIGLLSFLAIATMTLGNLAAIGQKNIKRFLAYSSIAHAGYLMMGLAALNQEAIKAVLFYVVVYLLMNLGAFLVVILVANELGTEEINDYRGLGRRGGQGTILGLMMAVFLFSLTGLPPLAGFIGKFYLFGAVIRSGLYGLAIVGVLNSVVSLYYYTRVVKLMFFDEPLDQRSFRITNSVSTALVSGMAFFTIYLGLFWNQLADWVSRSAALVR